jgi:exodeoxyribonuclease VII small subunit
MHESSSTNNCPGLGLWVECASLQTKIQMVVKTQKAQGFESAMAELEKIVADMEAGKLTLEDSLAAYKRGAELLSFCRSKLEDAQQQVRVLEDGVLKDFSGAGESGLS